MKNYHRSYSHSLISVHHDVMWYIIIILSLVYWSLYKIVKDSNWSVFNKQNGFFLFFYGRIFFTIELYYFYIYTWLFYFYSIYSNFLTKYYYLSLDAILESNLSKTASTSDFFLSFYNFQKGLEHFIGYNFSNNPFLSVDPKIFGFSAFSSLFTDILYDKYIDSFLFNRMNIGYYYNNEDTSKANFFLDVQKFHHSTYFEFVCASFPSLIILLILIPSTLLLYSLDEELEPLITYKVIGHQWYWSYEFSNWFFFDNSWKRVSYNFDSSMLTEDNLDFGGKRLLDVDKPLFVPVNVPLRFLITSADVLHSWAIQELGIKIDATPGRLSHYLVLVRRPGIFYGQCSEICGVAHGFMPIMIKAF